MQCQWHTLNILVVDISEAISFVFLGSPSEASSNFLFFGLLKGVSGTFPLGSIFASEVICRIQPLLRGPQLGE